jgi:hypothetical protein
MMLGAPDALAGMPWELPLPSLVGTRAVGMGGAFVAVADDASGAVYNPASLGVGRGVALFGQTNLAPRETLKFDPKGIAYRLDGVGFSWANKIGISSDGIADYTFTSAGSRISSRIAVGVSAKTWRTHPYEHFQVFGNSPTYDIGVLTAPAINWRVGGRVGTLHRGRNVESATVSVARRFPRGWIALDGDWNRPNGSSVRAGIEAALTPWSAVRAGWNGDAPTLGVGFQHSVLRVDAAWTRLRGHAFAFVGAEISFGTL